MNPPPYDHDLEEQMLGSMLSSEDALIELNQLLKPHHFDNPENRLVYEKINELYSANNPVNLITVSAEVKKSKHKVSVSYVTNLTNKYIPPQKMEHCAKILIEYYMRRETMNSIPVIALKASDKGIDIFDTLNTAESILTSLRDGGADNYDVSVSVAVDAADKNYQKAKVSDGFSGLLTGIKSLDLITGGFQRSDNVVIAGRPGQGKALVNSSKVYTPNGFIEIGSLKLGDVILTPQGLNQRVIGVFPQGKKRVYRVNFDDGTYVDCCEDHLWKVQSRQDRKASYGINGKKYSVLTTKEISKEILAKCGKRYNYTLDIIHPLSFTEKKLLIDPYLMGLLIGDGDLCGSRIGFTNSESDIIKRFYSLIPEKTKITHLDNSLSYSIVGTEWQKNSALDYIRQYGLYNKRSHEKFIPKDYLYNTRENMLQILRGLVDTDGYLSGDSKRPYTNTVIYTTTSLQLCNDFLELVRLLGGKASFKKKKGKYKKNGKIHIVKDYYKICFSMGENSIPVSSKKHLKRYYPHKKYHNKSILSVVDMGYESEMTCISVDSKDKTFITDFGNITHNSATMLNIARYNAVQKSIPTFIFSLEMSREQLITRLISDLAQIDYNRLQKGQLSETEESKYEYAKELIVKSPLYIDDRASLNSDDFRSRVKKYKRKYNIELVLHDYIQLRKGKGSEPRTVVMETTRTDKLVAKENDIVVIDLSQLSRSSEKRGAAAKPMLSDLKESGSIEEDADIVIFPYRPSYYGIAEGEGGEDLRNKIQFFVEKNRKGSTGNCWAWWYGNTQSIKNEDRDATQFPILDNPFSGYTYQQPEDEINTF